MIKPDLMHKLILSCLYATLVILIFASTAIAAEIELVNLTKSDGETCNLRLRGTIQPGDFDKLVKARRGIYLGDPDENHFWKVPLPRLCLDSPGGSFQEGLKIAEFLLTEFHQRVYTIIESGAKCFSACAIIFMAGRTVDKGSETFPARSLHVAGKLGFHAPFLDLLALDRSRFRKEEVIAAHDAAVKAINEAMRIFNKLTRGGTEFYDDGMPWVRPSLFVKMLSHSPTDLFLIDTSNKAGRWGINLFGYSDLSKFDGLNMRNVCENYDSWKFDRDLGDSEWQLSETESADYKPEDKTLADEFSGAKAFMLVIPWVTPKWCVAKPSGEQVAMYIGYQHSKPEVYFSFPMWAALPPNTPIASLVTPDLLAANALAGPPETSDFNTFANHDLSSSDYSKIMDTTLSNCVTACQSNSNCRAYSFDKWNRWCYSMSSFGTLRFDPQAESGVRVGAGNPPKSTAKVVMEHFRGKYFPGEHYLKPYVFDGDGCDSIGEAACKLSNTQANKIARASASMEACETECQSDEQCVAFTYYREEKRCALFNEAEEYQRDANADSGVKRQSAK